MSKADSQNPNLDIQVGAFIRSLAAKGGKPLYEVGYEAARKVLTDVQDICLLRNRRAKGRVNNRSRRPQGGVNQRDIKYLSQALKYIHYGLPPFFSSAAAFSFFLLPFS